MGNNGRIACGIMARIACGIMAGLPMEQWQDCSQGLSRKALQLLGELGSWLVLESWYTCTKIEHVGQTCPGMGSLLVSPHRTCQEVAVFGVSSRFSPCVSWRVEVPGRGRSTVFVQLWAVM